MKVLHIITRLILGGAQQNTVLTCAGQVAAGHRVWLAYGSIYGPEGSLLNEAKATGAELVCIPSMRRSILPWQDVRCSWALRRLIRRVKPDVVHTHSSKAGIVGRAAAWRERVPAVVHTVHGLPFHERNPALVNRLYVAAERWSAQRCHRIIGVTQAMCDEFLQRKIGKPEQFTVVPSGMDIDEFQLPPEARDVARRELGIPLDAPVVGVVARLDKLKGQDDLIDILPQLLHDRPDLRLLFVGDGWHRAHLERRIAAEGLKNHVMLTGLVAPQRVPHLLAAMDIHVLPSYQEGQPRTLVQALLTGRPIIGYDAGGIRDVCINDQTGRLVPLGDKAALAAAIHWMLTHPEERRRLGEQGLVFARQRYSHRVMVEKIEAIYQELIAYRHRSADAFGETDHRTIL